MGRKPYYQREPLYIKVYLKEVKIDSYLIKIIYINTKQIMNNDDDGMIDVTHYVEFPNETGKYWLGIGRIAETNNVYIERFQKMSFTKNIT